MEFFCFALPPAWKSAHPAGTDPRERGRFPSRCPGKAGSGWNCTTGRTRRICPGSGTRTIRMNKCATPGCNRQLTVCNAIAGGQIRGIWAILMAANTQGGHHHDHRTDHCRLNAGSWDYPSSGQFHHLPAAVAGFRPDLPGLRCRHALHLAQPWQHHLHRAEPAGAGGCDDPGGPCRHRAGGTLAGRQKAGGLPAGAGCGGSAPAGGRKRPLTASSCRRSR